MWRLSAFRHDDSIPGDEVLVFDDDVGKYVTMSKRDAIERAHAAGLNLFAAWPEDGSNGPVPCRLGKIALPLRWESAINNPEPDVDDKLWFEAPCGGRDYLVEGSPHTFTGRMIAWCPDKQVRYRVSLAEMGEMSEQARYFTAGFLSGNEPDPPMDQDGEIDEADLVAWQSATSRFRSTGSWYGRWSVCDSCGCVLLPDSAAAVCATCSAGTVRK